MLKAWVGLLVLFFWLCLCSRIATGVELAKVEGFGPISRGLAGAGVAYRTGAAAIMLNPAELISLDSGHELLFQLSEINTKIEIWNGNTGEYRRNENLGNNRGPYQLPEIAYAYRGDYWAIGLGIFSAAGFGVEYGDNSFLSRTTTANVETGLDISARLAALRMPFAFAWQARPQLRLGFAVDIVNLGVNLATLYDVQQFRMLREQGRVEGSLADIVSLLPTVAGVHIGFVEDSPINSGLSAWGVGGRLGLSWQFSSASAVAVAYETQTALSDLKGRASLTAVDIFNTHLRINGRARLVDLQLPESISLGISHILSPALSLAFDLRHTRWESMLGEVLFEYEAEGGLLHGQKLSARLPLGFNNVSSVSFGVEWQCNQRWTLRAGASRALNKLVQSDSLSGSFPTITNNHVVLSGSYLQRGGHEFSMGMTYAWSNTVHNSGSNEASVPQIRGRNRQITPALSYRKFF